MKTCLFSVSYAGLWGQAALDVSAFIAKAAALEFDSVMLMGKRPHLSPIDATDEALAAVRDHLQMNKVGCAAIGGYTDLSSPMAVELPFLEMQIGYVVALCRIAAKLDCGIVRVFTAYEVEGHSFQSAWGNVVKSLREMCDRAADYGITLAVQNHHDIGVHTDSLLELLADVDRRNCKVGFDAWSPALRGEDLYESAKRMAPHTVITTNADYVRLPRFQYEPAVVNYRRVEPDLVRAVQFGTGFIDYEAFFRGLRDGGFDGIATYEMCSPLRGGGSLENLDRYAVTYIRWMQEHGSKR